MNAASGAPSSEPLERDASRINARDGKIDAGEIAIGVIIGRTSEFFDFFVYAIASVVVFPQLVFPYAGPLGGTLLSFAVFAVAFIARPFGTALFIAVDRRFGRGTKLTIALFLLGLSTVCLGFLPGHAQVGHWSAAMLIALRIGQGVALGGAWDGMASLLAVAAPEKRRGWYAMVPQLGAPFGLIVASALFAYFLSKLSAADFMDWGWRYPFFVAFAINVVALFARLRIVVTPTFQAAFKTLELHPTPVTKAVREEGGSIVIGAFAPLASFAMFHMVTVFPLSWVFLYTDEAPSRFLMIELIGAVFGLIAIMASGWLADRYGILGFILLGLSFGQASGSIASSFSLTNRYTASALTSDLAWLFGAGFAPLAALALSGKFGLVAGGAYLLSGAICTLLALWLNRELAKGRAGAKA